jgi:hypothetical protein
MVSCETSGVVETCLACDRPAPDWIPATTTMCEDLTLASPANEIVAPTTLLLLLPAKAIDLISKPLIRAVA